MSIQQKADAAVKAVCPANGISFGDPEDKVTWRISFANEATAEQRQAALDAVAAFDVQKVRKQARVDAEIAALEATITERRKREALLTDDGREWLAQRDAEIATLRDKRPK